MAKLRSVNTHFWTDGFVIDLEPTEKLLFLYLITNPLATLAGCYEMSLRQMVFDTGIDQKTILETLKSFEERGKIVYREGWILLVNFLKNQNLNTNMQKNVLSDLEKAPDWVKSFIATNPKPFGSLSKAFKGFSIKEKGIEEEVNLIVKPEDPVEDLNTWLDATATAVGAKDRKALTKLDRWSDVCLIAIREDRNLADWLKTISEERKRVGDQTQFFTPETCLQKLQMRTEPEKLRSLAEIERDNREGGELSKLKQPPNGSILRTVPVAMPATG